MKNEPLISIVMVNYNHEEQIEEAIQSVIDQSYRKWELIIVDDGSTDHAPEIIRTFAKIESRIKAYIREENRHICEATNFGLGKISGEYIARIDSDDVWSYDKLEKQLQYMREHPEGALCFTKLDIVDEHTKVINEKEQTLYQIYNERQQGRQEWIKHFFFYGNTLIQSTLLMKREVFDTIGGFNYAFVQGHDFDFFVRAIKKFEFIFLEEPLVKYRRYANQNSAWGEENNRRFLNEHMIIRFRFFDDMSDELFYEVFHDEFRNSDSKTHEELVCEQAFLLKRCMHEKEENSVLGLWKLEKLLNDEYYRILLEEKFKFSLKDFYREMQNMLYVTDAIKGELAYTKNVAELQKEHLQHMETTNLAQQEKIRKMENSMSWKVTKPLRKVKNILRKQ